MERTSEQREDDRMSVCLASYPFDLLDFLRRTRRLLLDQPPGQLALESDQGQGMPEQIMQIACHPQTFLLNLQAGQFSSRGMEFPDRVAHE